MRPAEDLKARIIEAIRRDGPLPIDRFFEMAVADPDLGYWQRAATIGAAGDFITAPEISQVFGELIGVWCAVTWAGMGEPSPVRLIELGPGRGTLMRDILRTAARVMPAFQRAADVRLVELSRPFRASQAATLQGHAHAAPHWHDDIADVPDGAAIIIANEFLDALPIRQFVCKDGAWRERVVVCGADGVLAFDTGDVASDGPVAVAPDGTIAERREVEGPLLAKLALRSGGLTGLFIDYGPAEPAFGDTLQAMRQHAYVDPLAAPGMCDLTAHVQFAAFAEAARGAGFATDGPTTQAEFLGALGLAARASRLMASNPGQAAAIELAAQRLVAPTGMGTLFKVLAVRAPSLPKPPPFG